MFFIFGKVRLENVVKLAILIYNYKIVGHRAGSASAVLGMLPLLLGSFFSPLAGIFGASAVPMGAILFTTSLTGFIIFFTLVKTYRTDA